MLVVYLFRNPAAWIVPLIIQVISYMKILRKMGKRPLFGIIPILGEMEMSTDLFRKMRSFWRPAAITAAMFLTSLYIGRSNEYSVIMGIVALIVYGIFLIRLYSRLAKRFGKGKLFTLGLILVPLVFLLILAFGKSAYLGKPEFPAEPARSKASKAFRRSALVAVSAAELIVLLAACFFVTLMVHPFRPVTQYMLDGTVRKLENVTDSSEVVGRETTLGADWEKVAAEQKSRDYFFPDHSGDKKVVVMEYIIGSNLEDARGAASVNIAQMLDSTSKGNGVDFVLQAGGSKRWFTKGIKDESVGRYVVSGGKIEAAEMLGSSVCMSEPDKLKDFIVWAKENYPADRYMLVLWDHGGGFASGYGVDDLNARKGDSSTMTASEIIGAIRDAGVTFDLIGFDACLMQNVEYANALEPYADYYLASEESEPGTGWFYTAGFGKLAEDPTLSTEEFGKAMVSSYDQCNQAYNDGEAQPLTTLSLVDLTLVKPVYDNLESLYKKASAEIADSPAVFANMSAARSNSYQFYDGEQVDMVSFLTNLKKADYKQQVMKDEELDRIADSAKACVVYRNSDSQEGINGLAIDFPYKDLYVYSDEHKQLKAVKYRTERRFFDRFCSIMASQRMNATADEDSFFGNLFPVDFTGEDWYVEGFEDYDTTDLFVDIPVTLTPDGYLPQLPEKTWDTVLDCEVSGYVVTDQGLMYIGREHFTEEDAEGHPLVSMDGMWAHINGHLVCYEADDPVVSEDGTSYRGTVHAILNGTEKITMHIEWDPVTDDPEEDAEDGQEAALEGHVTGYSVDDEDTFFFMEKGLEQFETGDTIEFLFDFYDEEGKLIKTEPYGDKLHVITDDRLTVNDEMLEEGTELQYFGILTDVYQRELLTEEIREQVQ